MSEHTVRKISGLYREIRSHHRRERILAAILARHGRAALEAVAVSLNLIRGGAR